ncbi:hypothetical protein [Sinorhizobium meliloti]|nr:hypothetical protein [Sinorhizobium meliloti]
MADAGQQSKINPTPIRMQPEKIATIATIAMSVADPDNLISLVV